MFCFRADLLPDLTSAAAAAPLLYHIMSVMLIQSWLEGWGWLFETITSVILTLRSQSWYLHTECKNMSTWNNYVTKRLFYGCKDVNSQRILSQSLVLIYLGFVSINYWEFLQFTPLYLDIYINIYFMALWWWFKDTLVVGLLGNHHFSPHGSQ